MTYRRLPYEEYFINTSEDFTHTGRVTYPVKYSAVKYNTTKIGKLLGIAHEVNYEIHYEPDRDVIQIHFQRTFGAIDWVANVFEFGSRYYRAIEFEDEPLQLRVHHGWGTMYLAIKEEVRGKWKELHDAHPEAAGGFTDAEGWTPLAVNIPEGLRAQLERLLGPEGLEALVGVLAQDPRPRYQDDPDRIYGMPFGGLDIRFKAEAGSLAVTGFEKII